MAPKKERKIHVDAKVQARIDKVAKGVDPDEEFDGDGEPIDGWKPWVVNLAHLMCDPAHLGATQEKLAESLGVSVRSVQRYMANAAFKAYQRKIAETIYGDLYSLWVAGMARGLKQGNAKFYEMFGKSFGMFKEVRQTTSDVNVVVNDATSDDIEAELKRLERDAGVVSDEDVVN